MIDKVTGFLLLIGKLVVVGIVGKFFVLVSNYEGFHNVP